MTINYLVFQQRTYLFLLVVMGFVALTISVDLLESKFNQSSFYIFESTLFSSFWLLFIPLLYGQMRVMNKRPSIKMLAWIVPVSIVIHLFAYPALISLISGLFYYHTYSYRQTLIYELTEYTFVLLIGYSIIPLAFIFFKDKFQRSREFSEIPTKSEEKNTSFLVTDNNRRIRIQVSDILFLTANSPYINIHHKAKSYLYNETLKSVMTRLNDRLFVRVHKSAIVNILYVESYRSRLNGDYDLTMKNGATVRLSRNYAAAFKEKFETCHQDTPD